MPQFTQGKWFYEPKSGYIRSEHDGTYVAHIVGAGCEDEKGEEAQANARLIATAQDMYSLLCVLHHEDAIPENLPCGYQALKRFRDIVEAVTGNKIRCDTFPHHKNSSNYFSNNDCEYYPCHKNADKDNFSCLFCYCPLYHMKDCPGKPEYLANGVKDCTNCTLPHTDYNTIIEALNDRKQEELHAQSEAYQAKMQKRWDYFEYLRSEEWQKKRLAVFKRDDYRCQRCGTAKNLCVHHLSYVRLGKDDEILDLITLCRECHQSVHFYDIHNTEHCLVENNARFLPYVNDDSELDFDIDAFDL